MRIIRNPSRREVDEALARLERLDRHREMRYRLRRFEQRQNRLLGLSIGFFLVALLALFALGRLH